MRLGDRQSRDFISIFCWCSLNDTIYHVNNLLWRILNMRRLTLLRNSIKNTSFYAVSPIRRAPLIPVWYLTLVRLTFAGSNSKWCFNLTYLCNLSVDQLISTSNHHQSRLV